MNLGDLGTPAQLWRRWVLLAAGHAACDTTAAEIRRTDGSARLESGGGWLRMRRMAGNRAVLWGSHPCLDSGSDFRDEMLDGAPDWSFDVDSRYRNQDVGFLGWYAHGSWSSVPRAATSVAVAELLAPVCDDAAVRDWWHRAWPDAAEDRLSDTLAHPDRETFAAVQGSAAAARGVRQLTLARAWQTRPLSGAATVHLRTQIHAQMRGAAELSDRGHPQRPRLLRQWARINLTGVPFRHAVCALGATAGTTPLVTASSKDAGLDEVLVRSLDNVLLELRMAETDEKSGAWLFARVRCDGRMVTLDRAYDGWPSWYTAPAAESGPTMGSLFAEMDQRAPLWRPGWATLLAADRY